MSLAGRVAVVTGASSGIGRAVALELAARGASLSAVGRDREALGAVVREAEARGARDRVRARAYPTDLTRSEEVLELAARVSSDWERVDVLVHSAGLIVLGKVEGASLEDFDRQYRTNLRGPYLLTRELLPALKRSRGQVVFLNSSAILSAHAEMSQYAATKAGLKAVADSLRQEVNADGVRVLSVYPGRTASPMQEAVFAREGREYRPELLMQPGDVAVLVAGALEAPRSLEVTDLYLRPLKKS